jgi:hypothetical protein
MMENGKSRKRRQLSPEEKWEIFLEVTSQEILRCRSLDWARARFRPRLSHKATASYKRHNRISGASPRTSCSRVSRP